MRGSRSNNRGGFWRGGGGFGGRIFRGNRGNRYGSGNNWQDRHNSGASAPKQNWVYKPARETPGKRLAENEIGVTEYMSNHEGFNGIIKSRYSDFQVSEINCKGEVAQLTTQESPKLPVDEPVDEDEELLLSKYNVEILPMDTWDQINKLVVGAEDAEKVEIDVTTSSKADRTKIHEAVKKAFGDAIVGSTVNVDDKKYMRFEKYRKGVRIDNRVKWLWPGEYVYFILYKENCDTMEAASKIAERLRMHMKPQLLGYAGTKDRRAKTSQWFSVRRVDPRRLRTALGGSPGFAVGNYSFHHEPLKLGMLKGNKFRIALRNVTADDDVITAACEQLKEKGFLNYYGLQRFGTRLDVPTFHIGRQLLLGNYKEAIDLILSEHEGPMSEALALYKREGAAAAAEAVPWGAQGTVEGRLLAALHRGPRDYVTVLQQIPRNTRLLYLHAYQSFVWNRVVSHRVKTLGLTPAVGDMVVVGDREVTDSEILEESDTEDSQIQSESEPNSDVTNDEPPAPKHNKKDVTDEKPKVPVKVLTQEDVDSGRYSILDIILPLPGFGIEYPPNVKEYYKTLLAEDGLKLELKNKHKSYSMSGAYRHVAVLPRDVSYVTARYDEPYADLVLSDLDVMNGTELTGIVPDGKYKALLLTLSLPVSCYATMALRELLKVDTSSDSQARQNDYHKRALSGGGGGGDGDDDGGGGKRPKGEE